MNKLDSIGDQGKIVLVGFLVFLLAWGIVDMLHIPKSDFTTFIATIVSTLWSILLFVIDPRKKTESPSSQVPLLQPQQTIGENNASPR